MTIGTVEGLKVSYEVRQVLGKGKSSGEWAVFQKVGEQGRPAKIATFHHVPDSPGRNKSLAIDFAASLQGEMNRVVGELATCLGELGQPETIAREAIRLAMTRRGK